MRMPSTADELIGVQAELAGRRADPWRPAAESPAVGGCFVAFDQGAAGPGKRGEAAWAAAAVVREGRLIDQAVVSGEATAPYEAGLLFLRAGPVLLAAVKALGQPPDVLLVNATGRDHPRHAGLALHLGALLHVPTAGVTHRPLIAEGGWPADEAGATSPLVVGDEVVGYWLRTRAGARPLAVHAAWRTDAETAVAIVSHAAGPGRTPEPLRIARQLARTARSRAR